MQKKELLYVAHIYFFLRHEGKKKQLFFLVISIHKTSFSFLTHTQHTRFSYLSMIKQMQGYEGYNKEK